MDLRKEMQELNEGVQDLKNQEKAIRAILYDDNLSASEKVERIKALTTPEQMEKNRIRLWTKKFKVTKGHK